MRPNQGINQVRAGADIQYRGLSRNYAAAILRQQIRQMVDIIRTSRHGWTEIAVRDIPVRHAIKMRQQRLI
jgi:predicted lipid carrier protein YhbT